MEHKFSKPRELNFSNLVEGETYFFMSKIGILIRPSNVVRIDSISFLGDKVQLTITSYDPDGSSRTSSFDSTEDAKIIEVDEDIYYVTLNHLKNSVDEEEIFLAVLSNDFYSLFEKFCQHNYLVYTPDPL